jgi:hypothetical protein
MASRESPRSKQRSAAAQHRHQKFVELHRQSLLRYLDGTMPEKAGDLDALSYVEKVLTEWHEQFRHDEIAGPDQRERTFWYALYQLEELVESRSPHLDPYEAILMRNLVEVRELLRNRQPLPGHRFMATRPDGL